MKSAVSWACLVVALSTVTAQAQDLFTLRATTGGTTPTIITAGGNQLLPTIDKLINPRDEFAPLAGLNFTSSLNYGGFANAITLQNGTTTFNNQTIFQTTLTIPSTGAAFTFNGATRAEVEAGINTFLKSEGAPTVRAFLKKVNENSAVGVTDGNPLATTAQLSRQTYNEFGAQDSGWGFSDQAMLNRFDEKSELRAIAYGGPATAGDFDETFGGLTLDYINHTTDTVSLMAGLSFSYRTIDGATIYQIAIEVGAPVTIWAGEGDRSWSWKITPSGVVAVATSEDMVAGGVVEGLHITSRLGYAYGPWDFAMINQVGFFGSSSINYGGNRYETSIDQKILRNGVVARRKFGDRIYGDVGAAYSYFLEDAGVKNYVSPTFGVSWDLSRDRSSGVRIGYEGDFGDSFTLHSFNVSAYFAF